MRAFHLTEAISVNYNEEQLSETEKEKIKKKFFTTHKMSIFVTTYSNRHSYKVAKRNKK